MLRGWQTIQDASLDASKLLTQSGTNLAHTQHRLLVDILRRNQSCDYGKQYGFERTKNYTEFRNKVPVVRYDHIEELVESQCSGNRSLCAEPVLFYEETSGSSSGRKRIPYTQASLNALQLAVCPWLSDLIQHRPGVALGHCYWSISPAGRTRSATPDGTPIGAPSDLSFLTTPMQAAFVELLTVPPEVAQITDMEQWRYHTLFALLSDAHLSLISVWNASFITLILDSFTSFRDRLFQDLHSPESNCSLHASFWRTIKSRCDKNDMLDRITNASIGDSLNTRILWPALDTISCWTDGSAKQALPALQYYFPDVHVQPKGLLATEVVVSVPLSKNKYPALAAKSAFFEFLDSHGTAWLAHELKDDELYEVVVTTYGGLYRYALGDSVRVRGHHHELPLLEFIGRSGITSDLRGEKLNDAFVATCVNSVRGFSMLAAMETVATTNGSMRNQAGYRLFVDAAEVGNADLESIRAEVEERLRSNPQYEYARRLGQLQPLTLARIEQPERCYLEYRHSCGQQLGDIKPVSLCVDAQLTGHLQLCSTDKVQRN